MDERSRHPYPEHPQAQATAPWPTAPAPQPGAPISGHLPHAGGGFVLPGAANGQPALSAHGGTIGLPLAPEHAAPAIATLPGHAPVPAPMPPAHPMSTLPQAWAFPTPYGMQLVQSGQPAQAYAAAPEPAAAAMPAPLALAAPAAGPVTPSAVVAGSGQGVATRRRVRWEVIVPVFALGCFLGAVALFVGNFDRMTGRDTAATTGHRAPAAKHTATHDTTGAVADGDAAQAVADASTMLDEGRFDEASHLLHPLLEVPKPDPDVVALADRVEAAGARNTALLSRLTRQRGAHQWSGALVTLGQLAALRPLSPDLVRQRTQARTALRTERTLAKARALIGAGRYSAASTLLDAALKVAPNKQLQALRAKVNEAQAAPTTSTVRGGGGSTGGDTPSGTTRPGTGGGAPPAGGATGGSSGARPPADVGPGTMPPRPDAPNPVSTKPGVSGQPTEMGDMDMTGNSHPA